MNNDSCRPMDDSRSLEPCFPWRLAPRWVLIGILAEVLCDPQMAYGSRQTVTLRAVNRSPSTFHDVWLWPVGFVDNLGFDLRDIRDADVQIGTWAPGEQREIRLVVQPRTTHYRAAGTYDIGLAVVNREGKHSLALTPLTIIPSP